MSDAARHPTVPQQGVLVGMSGGVDSAVAATLLIEQGHRVVGVTLRLWNDPLAKDERNCCSPEAIQRAKATAHRLGIPHLVVDAIDLFHGRVVQYFVDEYAAGRTPNPCVKCNSRVRFSLLLDVAHRLGLDSIATGHYARLVGEPPGLARAKDRRKDQSYVLAEVAPDLLRRTLFPVGEMTKAEVRTKAARAGLVAPSVPESQEICFIPDDDHRRFLSDRLGDKPGTVVDKEGKMLGRHTGTYHFTIGQRKGLGIAAKNPLYVVALAADRAEVVVGDASDLAVGKLRICETVRHRTETTGPTTVQVRSTGGAVPARMVDPETIVLEEPAMGVAPGQLAVLYNGEAVTLAGTIRCTEDWIWPSLETPIEGDK